MPRFVGKIRPPVRFRRPTRRRFIAYAGGALLAASGAIALVRTRGYDVPADRAASLKALVPWQLVVVEHLARRIAAPDRDDAAAGEPAILTPDDADVAGFIDAYIAQMPPRLARD